MPLTLVDNPECPPEYETPLDLLSEHGGPWMVVYTHPRSEKAFCRFLARKAQPPVWYLPLVCSRTLSGGRSGAGVSYLPLFEGFVFVSVPERRAGCSGDRVCGNEHICSTYDACRSFKGTSKVLVPKDQRRIKLELSLIASENAGNRTIRFEKRTTLDAGTQVRICSGPARGLTGTISAQKNRPATRIFLDVDLLGQAVSMEVDTDSVEPITP